MVINGRFTAALLACVVASAGSAIKAQAVDATLNLPDDPIASAQQSSAASGSTAPAAQSGQQTAAAPDAQSGQQTTPPPAATPAAATPAAPLTAEEQLKLQEKQRVFGVMATFNTTRNKDALPLSTGQKYQLFFKSATDPWPFVLTAFGAGIDQADNSFPEYGQGVQGYAKRYGAAYTDYFTGNLLGNAVLAAWFKEDPRYFQKGTGSFKSRFLWAASSTVWCKRDNGTWGPNYANVAGNLMGAAVSNLYYPAPERTVSNTVSRGFTVTAQAIIGSEVIEFWPDMVRHYRRKQAEKLARQMSQGGTPTTPQPVPPPPAPQH